MNRPGTAHHPVVTFVEDVCLLTYLLTVSIRYESTVESRRDAASGLRQLAESVESCCLVDRYSPSWPEAALIVILITVQYCECGMECGAVGHATDNALAHPARHRSDS